MNSPIQAVQAPYRPPPDLPSLLLKERIVYLGLPLVSSDEYKDQLGVDVTELIIAQLLYLQFDDPEKPIYLYINSTGTSWYGGDAIGFETEAFAICDTINYIKPPVHTICLGQAMDVEPVCLMLPLFFIKLDKEHKDKLQIFKFGQKKLLPTRK